MENIKRILLDEGHSLVVETDLKVEVLPTDSTSLCNDKSEAPVVLKYDGKGVSDLLRLLTSEPSVLEGARLADKVVGKAAAALMILGKVKAVYAETISTPALQLFASVASHQPIAVTYHHQVEYIVNRTKTGWCPMEETCKDAVTAEECLVRIQEKLQELRKK